VVEELQRTFRAFWTRNSAAKEYTLVRGTIVDARAFPAPEMAFYALGAVDFSTQKLARSVMYHNIRIY